jgi:clorobiocin biosynthesis protein CloN6
VLYVHPAKQDVDVYAEQKGTSDRPMGRPYGLIPVGVPALINALRDAGIEVRGISYPLERELNRRFDLRRWLRTQTRAKVILIDLHWYEHSYGSISTAEACKEVLPDAWTVLGGLTASAFAGEILEHFPAVDFIVRGDAEQPLVTLTQRLLDAPPGEMPDLSGVANLSYRKGEDIVENDLDYCAASEDLDRLDYVDLRFLDHHREYLVHEYLVTDLDAARAALETDPYLGRWIATARGCKYECSYCGGCRSAHQALAGRQGIVPRSPQAVADELAYLADHHVIQASLSYDIAEMGEAYWRELFSLIRKRKIRIGLYNECFQMPPLKFVKYFARSVDLEHSCIALSPLSGSERVRRLNGKQFSNMELINLMDALNLYNVFALIYFSLNLPGETEDTLAETLALAEEMTQLYPASKLRILSSAHTLDPLSPMAERPDAFDITLGMRTFMDWYTYGKETQFGGPGARTGERRGFRSNQGPDGSTARSLEAMADAWDAARIGHEESWWPIPPSW